jgi:hypothetical protein
MAQAGGGKYDKLATKLDMIIKHLKDDKPVAKVLDKLEQVRDKLSSAKSAAAKASRKPSEYSKFVSKHMKDASLKGKVATEKMKAIAAMWRKEKSK